MHLMKKNDIVSKTEIRRTTKKTKNTTTNREKRNIDSEFHRISINMNIR